MTTNFKCFLQYPVMRNSNKTALWLPTDGKVRVLCSKVSSVKKIAHRLNLKCNSLLLHRLSIFKLALINSNFYSKCQENNGVFLYKAMHTSKTRILLVLKFFSRSNTHIAHKIERGKKQHQPAYTIKPDETDPSKDWTKKQHFTLAS